MKLNIVKSLLDRLSCSLVRDGKKVSGHKILLSSLMLNESIRERKNKVLLSLSSQKEFFKKGQRNEKLRPTLTSTKLLPSIESDPAKNFANSPSKIKSVPVIKNGGSLPANFSAEGAKNKKLKKRVEPNLSRGSETIQDTENRAHQVKNLNSSSITSQATFSFADMKRANKKVTKLSYCKLCVDNVKPVLETRKKRKGRITYLVPKITPLQRQEGKAIKLFIGNATSRRENERKRVLSSTVKTIRETTEILCYPRKSITKEIIPADSGNLFRTNKQYMLSSSMPNVSLSLKKNRYSGLKLALSEEFFDAALNKGLSIEKKKQLHQIAIQNRAYLHFRWW